MTRHCKGAAIVPFPFRRGTETLIRKLREDNQRRRRLTEEEEARLLDVAPPFLRSMIIAALDTGMRQGEMLALRFGDIDWKRQLIGCAIHSGTRRSRPPRDTTTRSSRTFRWRLSKLNSKSIENCWLDSEAATGEPATSPLSRMEGTWYSAPRKGVTSMQPERPKLPNEAIELYNRYIHGEISRRDFLEGVKRFAIGGLAATAIVEALMPNYAQAQQVSKTDDRIKAAYMTVPSPQGNGSIKGYLVRPASADTRTGKVEKLPGVIVVHENRGLNPHIEDIARRMALAGFMAFAPDGLTSLGGFPGDDYAGGQLFTKIDRGKMTEDMVAAANWLKSRDDCTGKIGATGFCYGGGIANTLAVRLGPDLAAAAPFYGAVPAAADIPRIKGAVLVHHGELDKQL